MTRAHTHTLTHTKYVFGPSRQVGRDYLCLMNGLQVFINTARLLGSLALHSARPIVACNSCVSALVCACARKGTRDRPSTHCSQLKCTLPCSIPPHLPPFLHQRTAQKRRKLMNRRSLRSQMEYGFLFARNLRNTIIPNQNSMCSPTMVPALSSAASIGLVFET